MSDAAKHEHLRSLPVPSAVDDSGRNDPRTVGRLLAVAEVVERLLHEGQLDREDVIEPEGEDGGFRVVSHEPRWDTRDDGRRRVEDLVTLLGEARLPEDT